MQAIGTLEMQTLGKFFVGHLQHIKPYGRYFTALSQDVESLAKHLRNVQGKWPEIDSSGGQGGEASAEDASIWAF